MKKVLTVLMFAAVFGIVMGSVGAAEMEEYDFDGKCILQVPVDAHLIKDQVPFGEGVYGGGFSIHYFTDDDLNGESLEDYIASQEFEDETTDGNLTVYKSGSKFVVLAQSDDSYLLVKDKDLEEAKAIASSAEFSQDGSGDDADETANSTPFEEDTVVTIDGLNFTIPEGYAQVSGGSSSSDHVFAGDNSTIIISIKNIGHEFSLDDVAMADGDVKKEINGTEGIVSTQSGSYGFTYGIGDNMISVFAPDESVVSTVISS